MQRPHPLRTPHGLHTSACRYHTRRTHQSTGGQRLQLRLGEPRRTCHVFQAGFRYGCLGNERSTAPGASHAWCPPHGRAERAESLQSGESSCHSPAAVKAWRATARWRPISLSVLGTLRLAASPTRIGWVCDPARTLHTPQPHTALWHHTRTHRSVANPLPEPELSRGAGDRLMTGAHKEQRLRSVEELVSPWWVQTTAHYGTHRHLHCRQVERQRSTTQPQTHSRLVCSRRRAMGRRIAGHGRWWTFWVAVAALHSMVTNPRLGFGRHRPHRHRAYRARTDHV